MESRAENCSFPKQRSLTRAPQSVRSRSTTGMALFAAFALNLAGLAGAAKATDLISVDIHGNSGNAPSNGVALNIDGSIAAFYSDASVLVPNDTNQARDVFVRDRNSGTTERVSVGNSGAQGNGPSQGRGMAPAISDNGQVVAFYSDASNLVANDDNSTTDVFVRDRSAHTTTLVSVNMSGGPGNRPSLFPSISSDGRFVAFQSAASDLVPADTNGATDIFVRDLQAGTTERLCGMQPNASSVSPAISGDGRFVAFVSVATNIDPTATRGVLNIFVCDRTTGMMSSVSRSSADVPGDADSMAPAINFDGRFIAFKSESDNLVPNDNNTAVDVFVRDRVENTTERMSVSFTGSSGNEVSFPPAISNDGRFVAFGSASTNLVPNDANAVPDVFVRDRQTHTTVLADMGFNGLQADGGTPDVAAAISGDGKQVGFVSFATNLVPNDGNQLPDVFAGENPFFCSDGTCPAGLICVSGSCVQLPTPTSKTPSATPTITETPTPTPVGPTATPTETGTPTPTPTPLSCIGTQDCPSGYVCIVSESGGFGSCILATPTPTPQPCSINADCPPPLICKCPDADPLCAQKVCLPAVSPTPTVTPTPIPPCTQSSDCALACSTADDCHSNQDCVDGQCTPADRCVDGVCAPTRLCEAENPTTCLVDREACLNGACACGGDCNLDGFVFANEIAKMIFLLGHEDQVPNECAAGDLNQDHTISGDEVCKAVTNLGVGCPLGIQDAAAIVSAASLEPRTFTLTAPATVSRGQTLSVDISLDGGPEGAADVATAQLDLLFDESVLTLDPLADCSVAPGLSPTDVSFTFMPRRPDTAPGVERLRVFVADLDVCNPNFTTLNSPFGNGPLLTCSFIVNPTAPEQPSRVTGERSNLGDEFGNEIPSSANFVDITVIPLSCGQDSDCPLHLLCRNAVCEPECPPPGAACPPGDVCRTGACVPLCTHDTDCTVPGQVCRDSFCTSACTTNDDCSFGLVCNLGACVPPCTQDSDCPEGSICNNGGCQTESVPCTRNDQCPLGICVDGDCTFIACGTDDDCPTGMCSPVSHICVPRPCTQSVDCPPAEVCFNQVCSRVACNGPEDCPSDALCVDGFCAVPVPTPTPTPTETLPPVEIPTDTPTPIEVPTGTPTATATEHLIVTPTPTPTQVHPPTATPTFTATPVPPPSATPTRGGGGGGGGGGCNIAAQASSGTALWWLTLPAVVGLWNRRRRSQ